MSAGLCAFATFLGLFLMGAGLDLSHRLKGTAGRAAALLAPVGVLVAAAGAVSWIVPGFFD